MADEYFTETAVALKDHFDLRLETISENEDGFKVLRELLAKRIQKIIEEDHYRFFHILYRIDVDERQVKKAIAENEFNKAVEIIAELIIKRQMEKIKSRKKYSKENELNDDDV